MAPSHMTRRPRTMVPQQALFAMNSPFVVEQARSVAACPDVDGPSEPSLRITAMYRRVLARDPSTRELDDSLAFVAMAKDERSELSAWEQLAQILLSLNELMYVD